jgi:hypothetical protein
VSFHRITKYHCFSLSMLLRGVSGLLFFVSGSLGVTYLLSAVISIGESIGLVEEHNCMQAFT